MGVATMNSLPRAGVKLSCESMKRTYLFFIPMSLLLVSLLSACGSHKSTAPALIAPTPHKTTPQPQEHAAKQAEANRQHITDLMLQAQDERHYDDALQALQTLAQQGTGAMNQEAAFRRVQLLLQHHQADADREAAQVLQQYPNHPLAAYTHFWLAQWWLAQAPMSADNGIEDNAFTPNAQPYANQVLHELTQALQHPHITDELTTRCIALSQQVMGKTSNAYTIPWYFAAAQADQAHKNYWLQIIDHQVTLDDVQTLQEQGIISPKRNPDVYLHLARQAMMQGKLHDLQRIQNFTQTDNPNSPLNQQLQAWLTGARHPIRIGILLPLSGTYARFGQQALQGIRLASETPSSPNTLLIQDTASQDVYAAYQALVEQHADVIIGPLLSKHSVALAPQLRSDIPVISISRDNDVAALSPALFIHNLAPETQARFMAAYAVTQGIHRIAIIQSNSPSANREADAFISRFAELGGDIADAIALDDHNIDHRPILHQMRENSDDEVLLHQLLQDKALFIAAPNLDIYLPPHIDALYLAMNGKQVSELAGQLAYVDIRNIPLLGSSRWMDGHLLDDRGRNLSTSRFIQDANHASGSDLSIRFREVFGDGTPSKLFTIAYDTTQIIELLGSQLGLNSQDMQQALYGDEGFPCNSGQVHFNADGLGEKTFSVYRIQHHSIVPAE